MTEKVSLLDLVSHSEEAQLELVRLDQSETAIVTFTADGERVGIHFCQEQEIGGYVRCNGVGCLLCRIGKKKDERVLIPVYLPTSKAIGILPVSPSLRPHALLPQLVPLLSASKPSVAFVKRDGAKFSVSTRELPEDVDAGEATIARFLEACERQEVSLPSVYQKLSNDQLAQVPEIASLAALKGVTLA